MMFSRLPSSLARMKFLSRFISIFYVTHPHSSKQHSRDNRCRFRKMTRAHSIFSSTGFTASLMRCRMAMVADKFDVGSLKKIILQELSVIAAGPVGAETAKPSAPYTIVYAYECTPLRSSLRKFLIDWYCYQADKGWVSNRANQE